MGGEGHDPTAPGNRNVAWLRRGDGRPLVVAHRGASGLAPENTLAAFRLAIQIGARAVECDVHLSADGAPVVIHDARVDRTTSGQGEVAALTLAELRRIDAGGWFGPAYTGERLPTLEEALEVCAGRARLFVELKAGGGAALVDAAVGAISGAPGTEVAVISFDPEIVRLVAARRPDLPLGWLVSADHAARLGTGRTLRATVESGAGFIAPHRAVALPPFVAAAHAAGLPVSAWTVDEPEAISRLAGAGVDAITTNRPDLALRVLSP